MDRPGSAGCRLGHGLAALGRAEPAGPAIAHSTFMTNILAQRAACDCELSAVCVRRAEMVQMDHAGTLGKAVPTFMTSRVTSPRSTPAPTELCEADPHWTRKALGLFFLACMAPSSI